MHGVWQEGVGSMGAKLKVWEKLVGLDKSIGYSREMAIAMCKTDSCCPANIEAKFHLVGDRRFEKHCSIGCGVNCVNEYLDLEAKN